MEIKVIKNFLTKNRCYQQNVKRTPIGIQLHTIGTAQGTAQSVADYWNQASVSACVTYVVDCDTEGKVLQLLPEDVRSWADAGYGNDNLITFEICESDFMRYTGGADYTVTNREKFEADLMRGYHTAVLLCADICRRYGWDPEEKLPSGLFLISSHNEGRRAGLSSAHVDPTHVWDPLGLSMDEFRRDVKKAMGDGVETGAQEEKEWLRVRKSWKDESSQIGAFEKLGNAIAACLPGYSVFDGSGKLIYSLPAAGFQGAELKGLTEEERIKKVAPLYVESAKKTGMLPSVGLAQFCLESGYGSTDLAEYSNNLHGMKCILSGNSWEGSVWDGKARYGKYSPEVIDGKTVQKYSEFRAYPGCEDSIADRAAYFKNAMDGDKKRYPGIAWETDYKKVVHIIKSGGYATDPEYESKLNELIRRWKLCEYDKDFGKEEEKEPEKEEGSSGQKEGPYIVQAGAYTVRENAEARVQKLKAAGFDAFIKFEEHFYKIQTGSFEIKGNAEKQVESLRKAGFSAFIR